jgi:RHS repeat-associated protein
MVTDRYVYDAFGRTIGQVGVTANVYLFAGEQRDANLGLDYLRARYLSIGTGRFASPDALAPDPENPESLDRYPYVFINPVNLLDPTGLWPTAIHNQLLEAAFEVILPAWEIKILKDTSRKQDALFHHDGHLASLSSGGQSEQFAYEHAMSSKLYGPTEAEFLYYRFLSQNLQQARVLQLAGFSVDSPSILVLLGKNLHAIADSTSPTHKGFQNWNPFDLFGPHGLFTYHKPGEKTIEPAVFADTVQKLRDEYTRFKQGQGITGKSVHDIISILTRGLRDFQKGLDALR